MSPTQFATACGRVLGGALSFTPHNTLTRGVGEKRKYNTTRITKEREPKRAPVVKGIADIVGGTCFPQKKRRGETNTCCSRGCNITFGKVDGSIERIRSTVPGWGKGQQRVRNIFARSCVQDDKSLSLSDGAGFSAVVCNAFFVAVTGLSKNTIQSAKAPGGPGM